jgi:hypothetical protein
VRIQRAMRRYLNRRGGFYKNYYFNASDYQTELFDGDTVKKIDIDQFDYEEEEEEVEVEGDDRN